MGLVFLISLCQTLTKTVSVLLENWSCHTHKSPRRHFKMYSQEAALEELSFVEMKTKLEPEQRAVYTNSNSYVRLHS